ncbi:MAG TPA: hypothetical protein VF775_06260 [Geobacteraceae bacterium]
MKKLTILLTVIFTLAVTAAHAVVPFPLHASSPQKSEAAMSVGAKVYLFHSGTEDVKKSIHVNDILTVYREYPPDFSQETREVGKVKVLFPLGDYYFKGEVIEGEVPAGPSLAKKGTVACFIMSLVQG